MLNKIRNYIYSQKSEMLSALGRLIEIPSVKGEACEGAPFGAEPRRALDEMLKICAEQGFPCRQRYDIVGEADLAARDLPPALGILCHLDVVPCQPESWASDPYSLTERDGVLYGRGVIDDKGPAISALFAMKCVRELGIPLKAGVRLIFGTDEENGSEDMELYTERETLPKNVFTPDGSYPVINVEKGMLRGYYAGGYSGGVIRFHGGTIPNAVPDFALAEVKAPLDSTLEAISADKSGARFSAEEIDGAVKITAEGRAAHASTPESGINAVTALIALINRLGAGGEAFSALADKFPHGETDGAAAGLKASDSTGALTAVLSIMDIEQGECRATVDIRFPKCLCLDEVEARLGGALSAAGLTLSRFMGDEPHCVDENSDFVQALLRVYEQVEGKKGGCIAIGGGTYVHNIEGGVAFGAERGDTDYHMHGADELLPVSELLENAVMYAMAIAEICG